MISQENLRMDISRKTDLLDVKQEIINSIQSSHPSQTEMAILAGQLQKLADQAQTAEQEQRILDSLVFKSIKVRYSKIPTAHTNTFEWIFDDKASSSAKVVPFKKWLQSGSGVFWIAGKAGSGKSTLMKHLYDHQKVRKLLQPWTGDKRLVTAGFFFWNAGHELQRTQEGLLQSMLFEVLRQSPALIEKTCPGRWNAKHLFDITEPWTRDELVEAFRTLILLSAVDTKFCLFVDGLDEYSGDHRELVHLLQTVFDSSVIKLCVSSRPWNIFQEVFGQSEASQLLLEELTKDDIRTYVRDLLEDNDSFRALKERDHRYQELVNEITGKARGVFLWVTLVVRSLLHGLTNADSVRDLQRRLRRLPEELEPYFRHMLDGVEPIYRKESAELFEISLAAAEPYTLMTYHFADDECLLFDCLDPRYPSLDPLEPDDFSQRLQTTRKRINARCLGLVEVREIRSEQTFTDPYKWYTVDFLHRTVRDFLQTKDIRDLLNERIEPGFHVHNVLCTAFVRQLQYLRLTLSEDDLKPGGIVEGLAGESLYHARCAETDEGSCPFEALEELDKTLSSLCREASARPTDMIRTDLLTEDFIHTALEKQLFIFTYQKLCQDTVFLKQESLKEYLLVLVLTQLPPSESALDIFPELISILVKGGARPFTSNAIYPTRSRRLQYLLHSKTIVAPSPWDQYLRFMRDHRVKVSKLTISVWFHIAEILVTQCTNARDMSAYAIEGLEAGRELLSTLFPRENVDHLLEIFKTRTMADGGFREQEEDPETTISIPPRKSILDWVPGIYFGR